MSMGEGQGITIAPDQEQVNAKILYGNGMGTGTSPIGFFTSIHASAEVGLETVASSQETALLAGKVKKFGIKIKSTTLAGNGAELSFRINEADAGTPLAIPASVSVGDFLETPDDIDIDIAELDRLCFEPRLLVGGTGLVNYELYTIIEWVSDAGGFEFTPEIFTIMSVDQIFTGNNFYLNNQFNTFTSANQDLVNFPAPENGTYVAVAGNVIPVAPARSHEMHAIAAGVQKMSVNFAIAESAVKITTGSVIFLKKDLLNLEWGQVGVGLEKSTCMIVGKLD